MTDLPDNYQEYFKRKVSNKLDLSDKQLVYGSDGSCGKYHYIFDSKSIEYLENWILENRSWILENDLLHISGSCQQSSLLFMDGYFLFEVDDGSPDDIRTVVKTLG